jgi:hypothetical protein
MHVSQTKCSRDINRQICLCSTNSNMHVRQTKCSREVLKH